MADSTLLKGISAAVGVQNLKAERELAPALAAKLTEIQTKAKALTDALAADDATIAGCATQIAALTALYPAAS